MFLVCLDVAETFDAISVFFHIHIFFFGMVPFWACRVTVGSRDVPGLATSGLILKSHPKICIRKRSRFSRFLCFRRALLAQVLPQASVEFVSLDVTMTVGFLEVDCLSPGRVKTRQNASERVKTRQNLVACVFLRFYK